MTKESISVTLAEMLLKHTHSFFQPVLSAAHHVAKPEPPMLNNAFNNAVIDFLSRFLSASTSSGSFAGVYAPNLRSGDVIVPASKEIIEYSLGSSGGECLRSFSKPSVVLDHWETDRSTE